MTHPGGVEVGDPDPSLCAVAVYRRAIGASLERVWENVLDWEHLPWLHASTFAEIECESSGDWGWRARVGHPGGAGSYPIELQVDRSRSRYVTRVLGESSVASEIWTRLSARAERITDIEVEFRLAPGSGSDPDSLGQGYIALYTRLWDEDEAMMQHRQRELDRSAEPLRGPLERVLGTREDVLSRVPYSVELAGQVFRVARVDGELIAYSTRCPHQLGPLVDDPTPDGKLVCPWHGYAFDLRSGRSCDGRGLRMPRSAKLIHDPVTDEVTLRHS
jgi:nitrite reductase/ring-hydroxylating ferredoxin subunit